MSVRPSVLSFVSPHRTRQLLEGFWWNLISEFSRICRKYSRFIKILTRITGTLHKHVFTFITYLWILLRMRNISDKICKENQNRFHFLDFRLSPSVEHCFHGFDVSALCARWIYRRRFGDRCGSNLYWTSEDVTHSGPRNVVDKFTSHTVQTHQSQKNTFYIL